RGRFLLATLDLGDVAEAHPRSGGHVAQGPALLEAKLAQHVTQQSSDQDHGRLLPDVRAYVRASGYGDGCGVEREAVPWLSRLPGDRARRTRPSAQRSSEPESSPR